MKIQDWFTTRDDVRRDFLRKSGWPDAGAPLGGDCAFRRYFRLNKNGAAAILMESVPEHEGLATPGHKLSDYIRIAAYLKSIELRTPEIYNADVDQGYLLIEDFGTQSFKSVIDTAPDRRSNLYETATDVLRHLRERGGAGGIDLPLYRDSHVHKGRRRVIDWYVPAVRGVVNPDGLVESYLAVWNKIEKTLSPVATGFLHIDYHFENLMWLADGQGIGRCGILDFQGAMTGPMPYDLANLLEDARTDVPVDLRAALLKRFCAGMNAAERDVFDAWYRILATQFHCRVIGQFIRIAVLDGKTRYLGLIPRVAGYIRSGLHAPVLEPLKDWFEAQKIDFAKVDGFDPAKIKTTIRPDAF